MVDRSRACCSVVELRQYTLRSGQRDALIALFDREFVETQEAVGMHVVGQFRDIDSPDRFVWLRGFTDMESRATSLTEFYGGPVWAAHGQAASATMLDSDDVLLLQPVDPGSGLAHPPPPRGGVDPEASVVEVSVYPIAGTDKSCASFVAFYVERIAPLLEAAGAPPIAWFVTLEAENTFPALPVRTGENVLVSLARFRDVDDLCDHVRRLHATSSWTEEVEPALATRLSGPVQRLRLAPTSRSELR
jgi:hypothetical protein